MGDARVLASRDSFNNFHLQIGDLAHLPLVIGAGLSGPVLATFK